MKILEISGDGRKMSGGEGGREGKVLNESILITERDALLLVFRFKNPWIQPEFVITIPIP